MGLAGMYARRHRPHVATARQRGARLPDARERAHLDAPVLLHALGANDVHALRVGADLAGVQRLRHLLHQRRLVLALPPAPARSVSTPTRTPPLCLCTNNLGSELEHEQWLWPSVQNPTDVRTHNW